MTYSAREFMIQKWPGSDHENSRNFEKNAQNAPIFCAAAFFEPRKRPANFEPDWSNLKFSNMNKNVDQQVFQNLNL